MRNGIRRVGAPLVLVGCAGAACVTSGATLVLALSQGAQSPHGPQVMIRQVTTLDARGHVARVFKPGSVIKLRIQWSVRNATPRVQQTTTWIVLYGGKEMLHVTKTAPTRDGNWSRVTDVTVTHSPHVGTHVFWGRISVGATTAVQSTTFVIQA